MQSITRKPPKFHVSIVLTILIVLCVGWTATMVGYVRFGGNPDDSSLIFNSGACIAAATFLWFLLYERRFAVWEAAWKERRVARKAEAEADAAYQNLRFEFMTIAHRSLPVSRKEFESNHDAIVNEYQPAADNGMVKIALEFKDACDFQREVDTYAKSRRNVGKETDFDREQRKSAAKCAEHYKQEFWGAHDTLRILGFEVMDYKQYLELA